MELIEITKDATLGFYNGTGLLKVPVKQYDNARKIRIMLMDDTGEEYIIPDDIEINFKALKPDKTQINTSEVLEVIDNRIIVSITDQMTIVAGIVHCEIILHKDGKRITTTKFDLIVEDSVHDNSHIEESTDYNDVLNAIEDVKLVIEGYEKAKSDIDTFQRTLEANEDERISNEKIRQTQEAARQTNTQIAIDNSNTATQNANDAADHATTVTDKLEDTLEKGELKAQEYYQLAESYTHGGTGIRENEDTDNADYYRRLASDSQVASKTSEDNARTSETNAKDSEDAAKISEGNAKESEDNAKISETNANASKIAANASADSASTSATTATQKASEASVSATEADAYATKAQSYTVGGTGTRENEDIDNAKKYYEQIKTISSSLKDALKPMGTIIFSDLPDLSTVSDGDMYNISDAFTTTENFKEGPGHTIPAGANIYKEATDDKWDVLAGTPVASVNGETGDVEITAQNTTVTDTHALLGTASADLTVQVLIDEIVDRVIDKLLPRDGSKEMTGALNLKNNSRFPNACGLDARGSAIKNVDNILISGAGNILWPTGETNKYKGLSIGSKLLRIKELSVAEGGHQYSSKYTPLLDEEDIVNDLNSTETKKLLSANMGRELDGKISELNKELANGNIQFDSSITSLSSPTQLKHGGFYIIPSMTDNVNAYAGSHPMTDYAVGDFRCLLMYGNSIFGVFLVTSPRNDGIIWKGTIWESKFVCWDRLATESYITDMKASFINDKTIDSSNGWGNGEYGFCYRDASAFGRNNNADLFVAPGWYITLTSTGSCGDWGIILVFSVQGPWIWQLWFTTKGKVYHRQTINSNTAWTSWKEFAFV